MKYFRILGLTLLFAIIFSHTSTLGANGYSIIDLGVPSVYYDDTYPVGINNAGQVIGWANPTDSAFNFQRVSFVVTPENGVYFKDEDGDGGNDLMQLLAPPESLYYSITDINDSGHIIGEFSTNGFFVNVSYVWKDGIFTTLGPPAGLGVVSSKVYSINNLGQVLGYMKVDTTWAEREVYIWNDGTPSNFSNDFLFGTDMFINDLGEVVLHRTHASRGSEPVFIRNGAISPIENNNAVRSDAFALNNNSQVVGIDVGSGDAFIWENNQMTLLGSETFFAYDINNNEEVVGSLGGGIGLQFLWLPQPAYGFPAGLQVMDSTISLPSRIDKMEAINDDGVILVAGRIDGNDRAIVMALTPPPSMTVNSVGDAVDNNPGDGICNTGNTIAGGDPECTMRAALMESNALAENVIIDFDIPVEPTIQPNSALPQITDSVYIDGYSQPGSSPVLLDGLNAGDFVDGLVFASDAIWVEGLFIGRFDGNGILQLIASSCKISGCTIGFTDAMGVNFGNNFNGISLISSSENDIGGKESWEINRISNNGLDGISLSDQSYNNVIINNIIGKGASGNELGNSEFGIYIGVGADTNIIGLGDLLGLSNQIRGNNKSGIYIDGAEHTRIIGNEITENIENGLLIDNFSSHTDVYLNKIGVTFLDNPAGNLANGIVISAQSDSNNIGGEIEIGNAIKNNGANGIKIEFSQYNNITENFLTLNGTNGIHLDSSSMHNRIFRNKIGIDEDGFGRGNKNFGIIISANSDLNFIGGATDSSNQIANGLKGGMKVIHSSYNQIDGNEITLNLGTGLLFDSSSQHNVVINNKIGVDFDGLEAGNLEDGIQILHNSDSNFIGTDNQTGNFIQFNITGGVYMHSSEHNLISGNIMSSNYGTGLHLDSMSNFNLITKNKIGLDSIGGVAGNEKYGIAMSNASESNLIGGMKVDGNVISSNWFSGILIDSSHFNQIQGNIIGLDTTGMIAIGNKWDGVSIFNSQNTFVGVNFEPDSTLMGEGNLISANDSSGVNIGNNSKYIWITANIIGRGIDTVVIQPNMWGVTSTESEFVYIGGNKTYNQGMSNYILNNNKEGVSLYSDYSDVIGNYIWENGYGNQGTPGGAGIFLKGRINDIGGITKETGNSIYANNGAGIFLDTVYNPTFTTLDDFNMIRFNQISSNVAGGIDIFPIGPNPNDSLDFDSGPNDEQNSPQLLTAMQTGSGQIVVTGILSSEPNLDFYLDFYGNRECDSLGLGQGEVWLHSDTITTDNFGFATFYVVSNNVAGFSSDFITATASGKQLFNNETSEFSNCFPVVMQNPGVDLFVVKTDNVDSLLFGDTVTYEIEVTNIGSDDATNVLMRDSLPSQLTYISDSTTLGICTELDGIIQCNLGTMTSGANATILIKALSIDSALTENKAIVSANEVDIQPINNSSTDTTHIVTKIPTDIGDDVNLLPTKFDLAQNYPNPFNPSTEIKFSLPTKSHVSIEVFNVVGQKVKTLLNTQISAGFHSVAWHGKNELGQTVSSGIYVYRFTADEFTLSKKMLLLK